jgi:hypothetical protein
MPVVLMSASTLGSIRPGGGGGATAAMSFCRPSHCAALKTVKRFGSGKARASSPVSLAQRFSSADVKRSR